MCKPSSKTQVQKREPIFVGGARAVIKVDAGAQRRITRDRETGPEKPEKLSEESESEVE